jgi:hypothetical protein
MQFGKKLAGVAVGFAASSVLAPGAALACPAASGHACGLASGGGYLAAVMIGLLVGIGSVAFERSKR